MANFVFAEPAVKPGEAAATIGATDELHAKLFPILERFGPDAMMNALISVYLELSLATLGFAETDEFLRLLRRSLPKMVATLRAAKEKPAGNA